MDPDQLGHFEFCVDGFDTKHDGDMRCFVFLIVIQKGQNVKKNGRKIRKNWFGVLTFSISHDIIIVKETFRAELFGWIVLILCREWGRLW